MNPYLTDDDLDALSPETVDFLALGEDAIVRKRFTAAARDLAVHGFSYEQIVRIINAAARNLRFSQPSITATVGLAVKWAEQQPSKEWQQFIGLIRTALQAHADDGHRGTL